VAYPPIRCFSVVHDSTVNDPIVHGKIEADASTLDPEAIDANVF